MTRIASQDQGWSNDETQLQRTLNGNLFLFENATRILNYQLPFKGSLDKPFENYGKLIWWYWWNLEVCKKYLDAETFPVSVESEG